MKFGKDTAVIKAGLVHLFTASGALVALFSLQAIYLEHARAALLWLLLAFVMDGLDGPLARRFEVRKHLPQIDGTMLDLIVDFLTYVLVPVIFMWQFELLPQALEVVMLGAILLSSLYLFVHSDMKTEDNFFNGFPSAWNLVLFFWVIVGTSQTFNAVSTLVLCVLTFIPIKTVHPVRVKRLHLLNVILISVWILLSAQLLTLSAESNAVLTGAWAFISAYFVGFSFWRTLFG